MEKKLPTGFILSIAQNEQALKYFSNLDEFTKNRISNYIQDSMTGDEAKERINISINSLEKNNLDFLI